MNAQMFIRAIKTVVCKAAAIGTLDSLQRPAGRRPAPELVTLSQWFHNLSTEDRENLARVVHMAANQTAYNFLLALDGLLAIEPAGAKGRLKLYYGDENACSQLNDECAQQLSALFKESDT
jgi:hypothetical protein